MKPKRLPRLWCAMQGLLPLDACLAVQEAELAWPRAEVVGIAATGASAPPPARVSGDDAAAANSHCRTRRAS